MYGQLYDREVNLLELAGVLFAAAVVAGGLGALLGLGGGFVIVPILTLVFHVDIKLAIGTSIVAVVATSAAGAARNVTGSLTNLRVAVFLATATTVGAVLGAFLAGVVDARVLFVLFGAILLFSAVQMLLKRSKRPVAAAVDAAAELAATGSLAEGKPAGRARAGSPVVGGGDAVGSAAAAPRASSAAAAPPAPSKAARPEAELADRLSLHSAYFDEAEQVEVAYRVRRAGLGLGLMLVAGTVSGLLGIGSGALKVPAMDLAMHLPMKVSTSTSNFLIGLTASASSLVYFTRGDIDPAIAGPVALGMLLGAALGARALPRIGAQRVRAIFVVVLAVVAVQMLLKGLG